MSFRQLTAQSYQEAETQINALEHVVPAGGIQIGFQTFNVFFAMNEEHGMNNCEKRDFRRNRRKAKRAGLV